jgi:prevent-host-death family protein
MTIIQVMTTISLADAKARLSAVLDEVRDTHERVVITRNGRPEAVVLAVSDLEALEETLDLLSTPGALDEIRAAEAEIARGEAIGAGELRRLLAERVRAERASELAMGAYGLSLAPSPRRALVEGPPRGLPLAVATAVTEFLTGALLDDPQRMGRPSPSVDRRPAARMPLPAQAMRIGRVPDNDLVLGDLDVSRHHAELRKSPTGSYEIIDLGSHNGTYVNGQRVPSKLLTEADLVSIGHSTFHLEGSELVQFVDDEQVTSTARTDEQATSTGQDLVVQGKPLGRELAGYRSARRGAYRVVYRIDDAARVVHVVRIDHRSSAYHTRKVGTQA